jgi:hypothetical protein
MVVSRCVTGADARLRLPRVRKKLVYDRAHPLGRSDLGNWTSHVNTVSTNGLSLIHYMSEMGVAIGPAAVCLFAATMGIDSSISAVMLQSRDRQVQLRHHHHDRPSLVRAQLRAQEPTHAPQQTAHHSMSWSVRRRKDSLPSGTQVAWSQARAPFASGWARLSTRLVSTGSPSAITSSARSGNAGGMCRRGAEVNFLLTTPESVAQWRSGFAVIK